MAKPDPALLDPARYPFDCLVETRYRDLDSNLHINNGAIASLLEEGRVRFHRESGFNEIAARINMTMMVASITIDYLGESLFPDPLEMHVGCAHIGRTSNRLAQLVTQKGRVVVFAQAVMVCVANGQPTPIPDEFRTSLGNWMVKA
ncbi:MAG: acyl-CoA thioesterase [Novosphingobium sp.]|nr:acyl-CoA thioesterase [Novosphingobium sp.]